MNDFFAEIEEVFGYGYLDSFSNDLYENNIYTILGLSLLISSFVWMFIYYYIVNHPKISNIKGWLIWVLVGAFINFTITYILSFNDLSNVYFINQKPMNYTNEFSILSLINFIWSIIFSFLFSIILKLKSSNASQTPF